MLFALIFPCYAPPGSGTRIGLDRDEDGFLDRDELDAGSDPADAASIPGGGGPGAVAPCVPPWPSVVSKGR